MSGMTRRRTLSPLVIAIILGFLIVFVVLVANPSGTPVLPTPLPPTVAPTATSRPQLPRTDPDDVSQRTARALEADDATALHNEMGPGIAATFDVESIDAGMAQQRQEQGAVVAVRVISAPTIRTEAPWNSEWADAEVEVQRERGTARYLVVFHLEQGEWWLFGTQEMQ